MKLQQKIDESCVTIVDLAKGTKISRATIYRVLEEKRARNSTWAKLAKYFNCTINDLKE